MKNQILINKFCINYPREFNEKNFEITGGRASRLLRRSVYLGSGPDQGHGTHNGHAEAEQSRPKEQKPVGDLGEDTGGNE